MRSRLIGRIPLDRDALRAEAEHLANIAAHDDYAEYTFGTWRAHVLWNGTGDDQDGTFRAHQSKLTPTRHAQHVPYIRSVLERVFDLDRVSWIRAFVCRDGVLVPHRDFIELSERFSRIQFPILTHPTCLHMEEDEVFHMRTGELWEIDATTVHGACSLTKHTRVSICVDAPLHPDGPPWRDGALEPTTDIERPIRPPIDAAFLDGVLGLSAILERNNVRDIVAMLARIPYYREAHASRVFDWLEEITRRSGNAELVERAIAYRRFCIEQRTFGEVFQL